MAKRGVGSEVHAHGLAVSHKNFLLKVWMKLNLLMQKKFQQLAFNFGSQKKDIYLQNSWWDPCIAVYVSNGLQSYNCL